MTTKTTKEGTRRCLHSHQDNDRRIVCDLLPGPDHLGAGPCDGAAAASDDTLDGDGDAARGDRRDDGGGASNGAVAACGDHHDDDDGAARGNSGGLGDHGRGDEGIVLQQQSQIRPLLVSRRLLLGVHEVCPQRGRADPREEPLGSRSVSCPRH